MQRHAAAARALACAGAVAGSVLAFSGARAAEEINQVTPASEKMAGAASLVIASLSTPSVQSNAEVIQSHPALPVRSVRPARPARVSVTITGDASFYEEKGSTSSGERYNAKAFTAAAQILLRDEFGGIRFGKNYQPSYGIAEWGGKKAIVKFNDVGPLAPGRAFDFSRAAMEYFDGIELGVLPHVTVRLLPLGRDYAQGPVTDAQLAALETEIDAIALALPQAMFVTASIGGAGCGSTSTSLEPISLDVIHAKLVQTASLDLMASAAVGGAEPVSNSGGQPNDIGAMAPSGDLP